MPSLCMHRIGYTYQLPVRFLLLVLDFVTMISCIRVDMLTVGKHLQFHSVVLNMKLTAVFCDVL